MGTKPRTSHNQFPGGERHENRKPEMIFNESMREGRHQSDEHWNRFKGNVGETSVRWGGVHMDFSEHVHTILKLN